MTFAAPASGHIIFNVPVNPHRLPGGLRAMMVGEARPEAGAARVGVARLVGLTMASPMSDVFLRLWLSIGVASCRRAATRGPCGA